MHNQCEWQNGKNKVLTDSPYIVTKEMVNGYGIVYAKHIDVALEIAKGLLYFEKEWKSRSSPSS